MKEITNSRNGLNKQKQIPILLPLLVLVSCIIRCTPTTSSSSTSTNSSIISEKDSISYSKKELLSSYDLFFAPCSVQKSSRVKFARLFNRKKVDAKLIVSMTGIDCCKIDFLFSKLSHHAEYDIKRWSFDYKQLTEFINDKRKCPKVVTINNKYDSDFSVMTCEGESQLSNLSIEALRFLNAKILGKYPCEIEYTYEQIDSLQALHPESW